MEIGRLKEEETTLTLNLTLTAALGVAVEGAGAGVHIPIDLENTQPPQIDVEITPPNPERKPLLAAQMSSIRQRQCGGENFTSAEI